MRHKHIHSTKRASVLSLTLAILAMLAIVARTGSASASSARLLGQPAVIYKECFFDDKASVWGRFKKCGVDEPATAKHRAQLKTLEEKIQKAQRQLNEREERQVEEYLQERFDVEPRNTNSEVSKLLDQTTSRMEWLLSDGRYSFSADEQATLQLVIAELEEYRQHETWTKAEARQLRRDLGERLQSVSTIIARHQRQIANTLPKIDNLVLKIDNLVTRVGTVVRDLERSGKRVPAAVRSGHRQASDLVAEAKRTCSTSRPEGCQQLREVLNRIDELRDPLCNLDSPILTFCN